jgi:hypothetical protein
VQTGCVPCGNQCCAPNNNENTRLHLSILFKRGAASPEFIERIANTVSAASGTPEALIPDLKFMDISVNIHPLLSTYFFYDGSLTAPPCSTKVTWLVLKTVLAVKDEHLHMFQKVTPGDSEYNVRAQKAFARTRKTVSGCTNSKWPCDGKKFLNVIFVCCVWMPEKAMIYMCVCVLQKCVCMLLRKLTQS